MTDDKIIKHIIINGCIESVCPWFKRTEHYDYNDELRCTHPKLCGDYRRIHEFERHERDIDKYHKEFIREIRANCGEVGLFPKFCPLDDKD